MPSILETMKKIFAILIICLAFARVQAQEKEIEVKYQRDSVIPTDGIRNTVKVPKPLDTKVTTVKKPVVPAKKKKPAAPVKKLVPMAPVKDKPDTLKVLLTPQQKKLLKDKNSPRRGATDRPNERTAK